MCARSFSGWTHTLLVSRPAASPVFLPSHPPSAAEAGGRPTSLAQSDGDAEVARKFELTALRQPVFDIVRAFSEELREIARVGGFLQLDMGRGIDYSGDSWPVPLVSLCCRGDSVPFSELRGPRVQIDCSPPRRHRCSAFSKDKRHTRACTGLCAPIGIGESRATAITRPMRGFSPGAIRCP